MGSFQGPAARVRPHKNRTVPRCKPTPLPAAQRRGPSGPARKCELSLPEIPGLPGVRAGFVAMAPLAGVSAVVRLRLRSPGCYRLNSTAEESYAAVRATCSKVLADRCVNLYIR